MNVSRHQNLVLADAYLRAARAIAKAHPGWIDGRSSNWAYSEHRRLLRAAYDFLVAAELGLLAGRVRWLAQASEMNVTYAWSRFDRLNGSEPSFAKGGAA